MSKEFYREVHVIRMCKKCGVEYRPQRGSFFSMLRLCHSCRPALYRQWNTRLKKWLEGKPQSVKDEYRRINYLAWKAKESGEAFKEYQAYVMDLIAGNKSLYYNPF